MNQRFGVVLLALSLFACRGEKPAAKAPVDQNLQAVVDSVMPRLQVLAGLKKEAPLKLALQDRDSLRAYIEKRMTEELPDSTLNGVKATYVALGLIPADFDLKKTLLDLYAEQVVGYYDPTTKTLYVITGADPEQLRPVLVHELVHALQDQHVNLDSLIAHERGNDHQTAAQAAIEGHATMVMVAYMAEQQTRAPVNLQTLPDIGESMRPTLEA